MGRRAVKGEEVARRASRGKRRKIGEKREKMKEKREGSESRFFREPVASSSLVGSQPSVFPFIFYLFSFLLLSR